MNFTRLDTLHGRQRSNMLLKSCAPGPWSFAPRLPPAQTSSSPAFDSDLCAKGLYKTETETLR